MVSRRHKRRISVRVQTIRIGTLRYKFPQQLETARARGIVDRIRPVSFHVRVSLQPDSTVDQSAGKFIVTFHDRINEPIDLL